MARETTQRVARRVYNGFERPPCPGLDCSQDPGKTDASQAPDCDINKIMANYAKTGVWPADKVGAAFLDVSEAGDFHTAMNTITHAQELFLRLDASIRKEFDNDPGVLMEALQNPAERQRLEKFGVLTPRQADSASRAIGDAPAGTAASPVQGGAAESAPPKATKPSKNE